MFSNQIVSGDILHLNVGGKKFSTSRQTLTLIPDTFFTALLNGRIPSLRDENGAIFIDRDPKVFSVILNYLRTKDIDLRGCSLRVLRHEAEYYNITPLVKRLTLCEDLDHSACGNVLFYGYLLPPVIPTINHLIPTSNTGVHAPTTSNCNADNNHLNEIREITKNTLDPRLARSAAHSRSSQDVRGFLSKTHSRTASLDLRYVKPCSSDTNKIRDDTGILQCNTVSSWSDPLRVQMIRAHHNWIIVGYAHFIVSYRLKESCGWQQVFTSSYIEQIVERVAINTKMGSGDNSKMIAISYGSQIRLWGINDSGEHSNIGTFNLNVKVEHLLFIGSQLVALSSSGKLGVWHAMTHHWQTQDVMPLASFDTAGSILLLGCNNGCIYYIDMQKFPLRMKDNDLLVTELYKDPNNEAVTAISVYLTPKTNICGNWIEIAYGTTSGSVRVIVQHPETVGHGPQLFQTFTVHQCSVTKITLSEKYLISVCAEYNHVRTWRVTRFRGMLSTQPGSTPEASFKIMALDTVEPSIMHASVNDFGPFGEQDDEQVFVQKIIPDADRIFVRLASNGKRVCTIKAVDWSTVSAFYVHECESSSRMGSGPRRYIFTGHSNGSIQMWDLTTALEVIRKNESRTGNDGGPSSEELLHLLDHCDISNSYCSTPCVSPSPLLTTTRLKFVNTTALNASAEANSSHYV